MFQCAIPFNCRACSAIQRGNLNTVKVVVVITFVLSAVGFAQTDDHAFLLLREVESSAQAMKSWRADVIETHEMTGQGMNLHDETLVKIAVQSPLRMRRENSGDDRTVQVCDGMDSFYSGDAPGFYRNPAVVSSGCNFPLSEFYQLEANPVSAAVIGRDDVQLADGLKACEVVRAEWNRDVEGGPGRWHIVRTMCIDSVRHLILRDSTESTDVARGLHSVETKTFTSFESNASLPPEAFRFLVPTGSMQDEGPKVSPDEPASTNGVYAIGRRVSHPRLISKIEPAYTDEAHEARASGLILVSLTVAADGMPQNMKVVRGLGHGLDEKAIESVSQWRFAPGMKDAVPVAVGPLTVAVNFQLSQSKP